MGAIFNTIGNLKQEDAANNASQAAVGVLSGQQGQNTATAQQANDILQQGFNGAYGNLASGGNLAQQTLQTSGQTAAGQLLNGTGAAQQYLGQTGKQGIAALNGGSAGQQAGYGQAAQTLAGLTGSRAGALLDQPGGLYGGYTQSPGYQYALDQAQQATTRKGAAMGGRNSGAVLSALQSNATGLANQDYQNYVGNQNSLLSASSGVDAYNANIGSAIAGNQVNQGNAGYSAAAQLAQLQQQLGQSQASVAQSGGNALAGLTASTGQQVAGQQSSIGQQLAALGYGNAQGQAGNLLGTAQINSGITGQIAQAYGAPVQYAGQGAAAAGQGIDHLLGQAAGALGGA